MPKISAQFENPWLTTYVLKASKQNKDKHCDNVTGAFENNMPVGPQFPPLFDAIKEAAAGFKLKKIESSVGGQIVSTFDVRGVTTSFKSTATYLDKKVKADFENQPGVYLEFFPKSLTETKLTKKGDIDDVITNWLRRATNRKAVMGDALVERITTLQTNWRAAVSNQGGETSKRKTALELIDPAWETFAWACFTMAVALLAANLKSPGILDAYFNMSIFSRSKNSDNDNIGTFEATFEDQFTTPITQLTVIVRGATDTTYLKTYNLKNSNVLKSKNMPKGEYSMEVSGSGINTITVPPFPVHDDVVNTFTVTIHRN